MAKKSTAHSPKFEKVKYFYDRHLWGLTAVANAVVHNWITADEYKEITGEDYPG